MLSVRNLSVSYGPVRALADVSLEVRDAEVVALLGANGAGKSTLLRAVSGLVRAQRGRVEYRGARIDGLGPHSVVSAGIAHCPEGRRVFPDLSVIENLEVGAHLVADAARRQANIERAFRHFPVLAERRHQRAGTLSGGEQQMLAVARSLMSNPTLLMLDEPSLGLAPMLIDQIFDIVRLINREEGTAVLLVEQNAREALIHADRGYVLEGGTLAMEGAAEDLRRDPRVIEAYLGR